MKNPWLDVSFPRKYDPKGNYILPSDKPFINAYNKIYQKKSLQIHAELLPVPFLGRLNAPILILLLNPGYSGKKDNSFSKDIIAYTAAKDKLRLNKHSPFYHVCDEFIKKAGGSNWWTKVFNHLNRKENISFDVIGKNFWIIEFFPYHSKSYKLFPCTLESQRYNFHIVNNFIKGNRKDRVVLVACGVDNWRIAVPELRNFSNCFTSINPRITSITPKMFGDHAYKKIIKILKTKKKKR